MLPSTMQTLHYSWLPHNNTLRHQHTCDSIVGWVWPLVVKQSDGKESLEAAVAAHHVRQAPRQACLGQVQLLEGGGLQTDRQACTQTARTARARFTPTGKVPEAEACFLFTLV